MVRYYIFLFDQSWASPGAKVYLCACNPLITSLMQSVRGGRAACKKVAHEYDEKKSTAGARTCAVPNNGNANKQHRVIGRSTLDRLAARTRTAGAGRDAHCLGSGNTPRNRATGAYVQKTGAWRSRGHRPPTNVDHTRPTRVLYPVACTGPGDRLWEHCEKRELPLESPRSLVAYINIMTNSIGRRLPTSRMNKCTRRKSNTNCKRE